MGAIFAGSWFAPESLSRHAPLLAELGINTAISLALAGVALLLPAWRRGLGWLIAAIGGAVVLQYQLMWMPPDGFWRLALNVRGESLPWAGHMAPFTAFSVLCAGLALAMLEKPRKMLGLLMLQLAPGLILAAVVGGGLNRALNGLLFMSSAEGYAVMSVAAMAALIVFVAGYLAAMTETAWFHGFYAKREERQAFAIGLIGLTAALLLGGATVIGMLGSQMQELMEKKLAASARAEASALHQVLSSALDGLHARAGNAARGEALLAGLRNLAGAGGAVWVEGADGPVRPGAASPFGAAPLRVRINGAAEAWLSWDRAWRLEARLPRADGRGMLLIRKPLPELEGFFAVSAENAAGSAESGLCGHAGAAQPSCFSFAHLPHALAAPAHCNDLPTPMWRALEGRRGIAIGPDCRGVMSVAAYSPVGETGLGMVRRIDAGQMYGPLRAAVWRAILFMFGIGLLAMGLVYLRVRRPVRRSLETGRHLRGVLDALPVGVWISDRSGRIVTINPAARQIWGGERRVGVEQYGEYKGWRHDSGEPVGAHEWGMARAVERGETSIDEIIDIECFDGTRKTISYSALPLRDEHGSLLGGIMVNQDITERKASEAEIRRLAREFRSLAENLPDMVSRFDRELRFVYVNPEGERSIGMAGGALLGRTYLELGVPDGMVNTWHGALRRVFHSGEPEVFECRFPSPGGIVKDYQVRAVPEFDADGSVATVLTVARDVSTLKGAQEVLRESEERFQAMASNVPGMVFQCYRHVGDRQLRFIYVSGGVEYLLGTDGATIQMDANEFIDRIVEEDAAAFSDSLDRSQSEQCLWSWEGRVAMHDGEIKWLSLRATPRRHGADVCMWDGVAVNVTESKANVEQLLLTQTLLRDLSAHLENVREQERKAIAREIHDELGQTLTALRMDVSLARLSFGQANPELTAHLQSMTQLVDRTIEIARHVTASLRPAALDLGIVAALEWLLEEFIGHAGIPCELVLGDGELNLDEPAATAVFRIVQESLTNIARHAEATQAEVIVTLASEAICFEVNDNGKGFDPQAEAKRNSFGLVGMRERVAMLQGELRIDSEPGRGTRVRVCIPV